ncbi:MAG TPA: arginine deiminase-related protein [Nitrospirota bacterium]|nr:arginine deiminase-related protein [Nitrospirota bacterium]
MEIYHIVWYYDAMNTNKHYLMCMPTWFAISYEINPWMKMNNPADASLAHKQWDLLYSTITGSGAKVSLINPEDGLPDMVFTANAGLVKDNIVILSRFMHMERQGEAKYYEKWFSGHGYHCHLIPDGSAFEGAGDAVFYKDQILLGYGFRTEINSHKYAGEVMGMGYTSLELINNHFYHLDTCLQYIDDVNLIIYYPDAFSPDSRRKIEGLPSDILRLSKEDAFLFACNSICINRNVLLYKSSDVLADELKKYEIKIVSLDISEFMKSGGSVRCMVLDL